MNIIYITVWGIDDPLTLSTVYPNIRILSENPKIESIHLFTVERSNNISAKNNKIVTLEKVKHVPINEKINTLSKALTSIKILKYISKFRNKSKLLIIARSSLAAIPAYIANRLFKIRFIVESYEPHSSYMLHNEEWNRCGLKYNFLKLIEGRIETHAFRLYPVSMNFKKTLIEKRLPIEKISFMPCSVNINEFEFDSIKREEIRSELSLTDDCIVSINVGKFGGIYLDSKAFQLFKEAENNFNKFHLILLSNDKHSIIKEKLKDSGINDDNFTIKNVDHSEVGHYLSAADFAFALIKTTPSSNASSAVKIGEYYASGLPIAITQNIGDDSSIIIKENAGEIIYPNEVNKFEKIKTLVLEKDHRTRISKLASKYRSIDINYKNYNKLVKDLDLQN